MAFSTRRYVKHIDKYNVTHRLEIQEDGFGGSEDSISTTGKVFEFEHETNIAEDRERLNVYENPVQKGSIQLHLLIQNSTDRTLIENIFNGDEDGFRLVWKIDGSVYWTGTILNDMLEYPESDYPYRATLWAKDFSRLDGKDYALDDTRQTLITTFADLLDDLGYGLDIETHTSWINANTTDATDFLQQIYHETKALREFARTGDESDETITVLEALNIMCRNFGCVVRQEGGVFKIIQYSEYETPSDVNVTVYDSTGTEKTAATSTDLSLDASSNDIIVTDRSITRAFKAIKRAKVTFDHRTQVAGFTLPEEIELADSTTESFSQLFIGDGNQTIDIAFDVRAETDVDESSMDARFRIKIDTYYLQDDGSWDTTTNNFFEVSLTKGKPLVGGGNVWQGSFTLRTDSIPDAADGTLDLVFAGASGGTDFADTTLYISPSFKINNPVAEENTTFINYQLTQSQGYSTNFRLKKTWFGDGPTGYSVSALRHSSSDGDVTTDSWARRGQTANKNFHENLLKEFIDLQRNNRIKTDGDTLGADYDPEKILSYRSKNLAYSGGRFDGEHGDWHPILFEINIQTSSDTFEKINKFTGETGSGTGSTADGGGIDQSTADYLQRDNNLSDLASASTARSNLGLANASADLDLNSISVDGTNLFPSDDPQPLGTSDSPTFAGATFTEDITVNRQVDLDTVDGGQANIVYRENGAFRYVLTYSPSDNQFRLRSGDIDGSGTTGNIFQVDDGQQDIEFQNNAHANDFVLT